MEPERIQESELFLAVRSGGSSCVIPISHVIEIMRPVAACAFQNMPAWMEGMAIIRGSPIPVVRLSSLLRNQNPPPPGRLVIVKAGERRVALSVDETTGILRLDRSSFQSLPPLLGDSFPEFVSRVQILDRELFFVLQASRVLTEEVWRSLEGKQG